MVSDNEFEKQLEEIRKQHRKEHQDALVRLKLKEMKIEQNFAEYIASDIIDSYDKLMKQRKETIDKFMKFFNIFADAREDVKIDELYKHFFDVKDIEFDIWKSEVKYFVELKKECENCSDNDLEKDIRSVFDKE